MSAPPFAFGSDIYPGLAKLIEEAGEVQQVAGKLVMTGGRVEHWDGTDLRARLQEEIADLMAACRFVAEAAGLVTASIADRSLRKLRQFREWHQGAAPGPLLNFAKSFCCWLDVDHDHPKLFGEAILPRDDDGMGFALDLDSLKGKYVRITIEVVEEDRKP